MLKSHLVGQDETVFPDDWTHDERRERVLAALERLKVRHRRLLVMHHVDGIGLEDIAAELGETRQAVESAVARARSAFRKDYDRVGREVDR